MKYLLIAIVSLVVISLHVGAGYLLWSASLSFGPLPTPREYMQEQCEETGCDFALLDAIVTCESKWIMVKNSQSSAYGYFQILDSTERTTPQYEAGRRKTNPYTNVDMGIYLLERHGSSPWNESKACWSWRYQLNQDKM